MAFLNPGPAGRGLPRAEINMIPLIDVMLVLLVIFIISAPLLARALKLDLPQADAPPALVQPQTIQLSIDAAGSLRWNAEPVTAEELALSDVLGGDGAPRLYLL